MKQVRLSQISRSARLALGHREVNGEYQAKGAGADSPQYLSPFDGFYSETTFGVLDIGDYLSLVLMNTGHISPIAGAQTD